MIQKKIKTSSAEETARIFGNFDRNINTVENEFGVRIYNIQSENDGGDTIVVEGTARRRRRPRQPFPA